MKPARCAALALLTALFATNCYRAVTQSVTHDEALTWALYLEGPGANIFEVFDSNHHFLGTLLERLTTELFGASELSLRLPSVLAGGLYFTIAYRLSWFLLGDSFLFVLSVLLLSAHPLVLDFMVAARGYGLALAFFMWGLLNLIELLAEDRTRGGAWKRLLAAGCQAGSVLLLVASHYGLGFPYPSDRTGLYFLPLATLCLVGIGKAPAALARRPSLRLVHSAVLVCFAAMFALQWNTTHFQLWRYDADTKAIFRRIRENSSGRRPPIQVGATWVYAPALNFYRAQDAGRFGPILATGPEGNYDYFVLSPADRTLISRRNLRTLWKGPVSGTLLAALAER